MLDLKVKKDADGLLGKMNECPSKENLGVIRLATNLSKGSFTRATLHVAIVILVYGLYS